MTEDHAAQFARGIDQQGALESLQELRDSMGRLIVGQEVLIERLLTALLAAVPYSYSGEETRAGCGHVLLEGVPGVAKTLALTTIAELITARFQRIQMAPDMLPADIIGTRVFEASTASFRVERGPVFTNILLADEINRATPKTQSALLEAMQERQVTIGEDTIRLDDPFWLVATQNPVEQEGVYSLPEAQLDRFSMMLKVEYPDRDAERRMLAIDVDRVDLQPVLDPAAIVRIRELTRQVYVDARLNDYVVSLGRATRDPARIGLSDLAGLLSVGLSPRSYQHLVALSRTTAFLAGRSYVVPEDVKEIFLDATRHRVILSIRAEAEGVRSDDLLAELLARVPIP